MAQSIGGSDAMAYLLALLLAVVLVVGFLAAGVPGVIMAGLVATALFFVVIMITSAGR